jgi:hypothetical protein
MDEYSKLVESVVNELLTEIIKVSLQKPTSSNALLSARYGKAVQNLRYQLSDLPGSEGLTVEPSMGGYSASIFSDRDKSEISRASSATGRSREDVAKEIGNTYMIRLEPANTKLGGIPGQASIFGHEAGHMLAGHAKKGASTSGGQAEVDREIDANKLGDLFTSRIGMEVDNTHQKPNLNSYLRDNSLPELPLTPEEEEYAKNREAVDSAAKEKDWAGTYAIGKKRFTADEPKAYSNFLVKQFIDTVTKKK